MRSLTARYRLITHYCSVMGISLNNQQIKKLVPTCISNIPDLYKLKNKHCIRIGIDNMDQILDEIEESRVVSLDTFLYALNIAPEVNCKAISDYLYGDINGFLLRIRNNFDWTEIKSIGSSTMRRIKENFAEVKLILQELLDYVYIKPQHQDDDYGKLYCTVGVLADRVNTYNRILAQDGVILGFVNSKIDCAIVGGKVEMLDKYIKVKELGIPMITEQEFNNRYTEEEN